MHFVRFDHFQGRFESDLHSFRLLSNWWPMLPNGSRDVPIEIPMKCAVGTAAFYNTVKRSKGLAFRLKIIRLRAGADGPKRLSDRKPTRPLDLLDA